MVVLPAVGRPRGRLASGRRARVARGRSVFGAVQADRQHAHGIEWPAATSCITTSCCKHGEHAMQDALRCESRLSDGIAPSSLASPTLQAVPWDDGIRLRIALLAIASEVRAGRSACCPAARSLTALHTPTAWVPWYVLGRCHLHDGDGYAALLALCAAIRCNPTGGESWAVSVALLCLARWTLECGQCLARCIVPWQHLLLALAGPRRVLPRYWAAAHRDRCVDTVCTSHPALPRRLGRAGGAVRWGRAARRRCTRECVGATMHVDR